MSQSQERDRRDVEEEEPFEAQHVVKGPEWVRKLFIGEENGD